MQPIGRAFCTWTLLFLIATPLSAQSMRKGASPRDGITASTRVSARVACVNGMAGEYPCDRVDLLSVLPIADMGGGADIELSDIWGWTDPQTGTEYAIVARMDGTSFVDLSDPENPVFVGDLPSQAGTNYWRDVKVIHDHAVIVADNAGAHGMQIFDLRTLSSIQNPPADLLPTAVYSGFEQVHNVGVLEEANLVFATGMDGPQTVPSGVSCARGMHMVDVSDPANPQFAGCFTSSTGRGYTHDVQCIRYDGPDSDYTGRDICIGSDEAGITISDVSDPADAMEIATGSYPLFSYVHQGWFSEDRKYFFVGDEIDELQGNAPLVRTLKQERVVTVVLADSRRVRLLEVAEARIEELEGLRTDDLVGEIEDDGVRKSASRTSGSRGVTSTDHAQRVLEVATNRMVSRLVEILEERAGREGLVIVGGPVESVRRIISAIPDRIAERTAERLSMHLDMTPAEVLAEARSVAGDLSEGEHHRKARAIADAARSRGSGALGPDDTLAALKEMRVDTLMLSRDFIASAPDAADEMVTHALGQGASLDEASGEAGAFLDQEADGVAARLRY